MKHIICIALLTLAPWTSKAQLITTKKNGGEKQASYAFASAGISVPQRRHVNTGINASTGPILALGYHSFFNKRWGMGLVLSGSMYKSEAVNEYSSNGTLSYSSSSNENWQKAQTYITFSYTPVLRKRWAIDIVQGFGLLYIKQPAYDYYYYFNERVDAKKDWSAGYNIALTARILLKDNIGLLASANFFHDLGLPRSMKSSYTVGAFDTVDWSLGMVYTFNK